MSPLTQGLNYRSACDPKFKNDGSFCLFSLTMSTSDFPVKGPRLRHADILFGLLT